MSKRQPSQSPLLIMAGVEELHHLEKLLNEGYESKLACKGKRNTVPFQAELRRLVLAWNSSGHNIKRLFKQEPMLARHAQNLRAGVIPSKNRYGKLEFSTDSSELLPTDPRVIAFEEFIPFLLHPYNDKLRGPCRYCERFFVNISNRKKLIYCSPVCGHRFTSRQFNRAQQAELNRRRSQAKDEAMAAWKKSKSTEPFPQWLSRQPKYDLSRNWITRMSR